MDKSTEKKMYDGSCDATLKNKSDTVLGRYVMSSVKLGF